MIIRNIPPSSLIHFVSSMNIISSIKMGKEVGPLMNTINNKL